MTCVTTLPLLPNPLHCLEQRLQARKTRGNVTVRVTWCNVWGSIGKLPSFTWPSSRAPQGRQGSRIQAVDLICRPEMIAQARGIERMSGPQVMSGQGWTPLESHATSCNIIIINTQIRVVTAVPVKDVYRDHPNNECWDCGALRFTGHGLEPDGWATESSESSRKYSVHIRWHYNHLKW